MKLLTKAPNRMIPLTSIPALVQHYGPYFKDLFKGSEYEHFLKYISGLLVSENKTVEGINQLFVLDVKDQSTLNRFLNSSAFSISELNQRRLDFLNQTPSTRLKGEGIYGGVLSLDDTLLIHQGKHFEHIAKLYDHVSSTYVWAHNLVNLNYSDDQTDYPVYFDLWKPVSTEELENGLRKANVAIQARKEALKEEAPQKWRKYLLYRYRKNQHLESVQDVYRTKILIGKDLLVKFFRQYPQLDMPICFDKWFTSPYFCKFITEELQKAYVCGLSDNNKLLLAGSKKIRVDEFVESLKTEHLSGKKSLFSKVTISYKGKKEVYYAYNKVHHICGFGRQKLLISYREKDLSDTARVFIGNRLHWRPQHLIRIGRHRWPVEVYHKEGKAEGLDKYQVRNFEAIKKHIALVALVYSLLKHAQHNDVLLNELQSQLEQQIKGSAAYWRRTIKAQTLWILIQWINQVIQQGWSLQQVMQTLKPAFGIT